MRWLPMLVLVACSRSPAPAPAPRASVEVVAVAPADAGAIVVADAAPAGESDAGRADACLRKNKSIRSADWANCRIGGFGHLRNGRGEYHEYEEMGGPHDTIDTKLVGVDYGDLDGDGLEDAAVALNQHVYFASNRNTSESGHVYVYSTKEGVVAVLAQKLSGRPMTSVKVTNGRIVLDEASKYETCKTELVVQGDKLETASERCTKKP